MSPLSGIGPGIPVFTPVGEPGPITVRPLQEVPVEIGKTPAPFASVLGHFVNEVNDKQLAAGQAVNGLLAGENVSLHQAMIAMEEASVSFQLMVEVRNKLLESYQELMRMQV